MKQNNILPAGLTWVSPDQAGAWRIRFTFKNQRPISPHNVQRLKLAMDVKEFVAGTVITFCVLPDGTPILVNGNHTLEAIKLHGQPVLLFIQHQMVETMDEVAHVYLSMDNQKPRTSMDVYRAKGVLEEIPGIQYVVPAVLVIRGNFLQDNNLWTLTNGITRPQQVELARTYAEQAREVDRIFKGKLKGNQRILHRRAFFSVILETLKFQPEIASIFWEETITDSGLFKGHPGKTLLDYGRDNAVQHYTVFKQIVWAARAWNAHYRNKPLVYLRPQKHFFLYGTPWSPRYGDETESVREKTQAARRAEGPAP